MQTLSATVPGIDKARLQEIALTGYAQSRGLDMHRLNAETGDHVYSQRVQEHWRAGERIGLRPAPAMFWNNRAVGKFFGSEKLEEAGLAALKAT